LSGVALARYVLRGALANHAVRYAVTDPPGNYLTAPRWTQLRTESARHKVTKVLRRLVYGGFWRRSPAPGTVAGAARLEQGFEVKRGPTMNAL
jgi:hypothetical protein